MENSKLIYLVDDDQDDLLLMKEALKMVMQDVDIVEFNDGKELLDFIILQKEEHKPALILMDINMPRVNGLEALHALKLNLKLQDIPIVIISTSSDQQQIRQAYKQGVSAFITKPVSIKDYRLVAHAIIACYLNHYRSIESMIVSQDKFRDKSILVIEDNADQWELMRHSLKISLPDMGIIRMRDRMSTLDYLTHQWNVLKRPPELIILDLYLPTRREGLNLLDSINYFFIIHRLPPVPVIIFSSSESREDIKLCYQHRANAYFVKSLDLNQSYSFLETVCHFWWNTISLPKKLAAY